MLRPWVATNSALQMGVGCQNRNRRSGELVVDPPQSSAASLRVSTLWYEVWSCRQLQSESSVRLHHISRGYFIPTLIMLSNIFVLQKFYGNGGISRKHAPDLWSVATSYSEQIQILTGTGTALLCYSLFDFWKFTDNSVFKMFVLWQGTDSVISKIFNRTDVWGKKKRTQKSIKLFRFVPSHLS